MSSNFGVTGGSFGQKLNDVGPPESRVGQLDCQIVDSTKSKSDSSMSARSIKDRIIETNKSINAGRRGVGFFESLKSFGAFKEFIRNLCSFGSSKNFDDLNRLVGVLDAALNANDKEAVKKTINKINVCLLRLNSNRDDVATLNRVASGQNGDADNTPSFRAKNPAEEIGNYIDILSFVTGLSSLEAIDLSRIDLSRLDASEQLAFFDKCIDSVNADIKSLNIGSFKFAKEQHIKSQSASIRRLIDSSHLTEENKSYCSGRLSSL